MPKSTDREMPKRKRCRKDLDRIHSKILKAKKKLDNVGKNGSKDRQRRQGQAKICTRLLPRPTIGIYRNGAKSKNIQKETSESTFNRARLKADALKLFNGDTSELNYIEELSIHNDTTDKQSPDRNFVKNSLKFWTSDSMPEESPILGEKQSKNQKPYPVKDKSKESFSKNLDSDKIKKQNINNRSKYVAQKENIYKQKLLQNDGEESKATTVTPMQMFDNGNFMEENKINENKTQPTHEDSKNRSTALNHYKELCKMISAINFKENFLQNYQSDPLTTIITKLKHIYSNSLRQQYLHEKNKLKTTKSSELSVENQACTCSNISQMSPNSTSTIEYEVPKCSENRTILSFLPKDIPEEDDIIDLQSDNIGPYDSISCILQNEQNEIETYTNDCNRKNCKNNQCSKRSSNIHQFMRAINFYTVNEKDSVEKHSNYINHSSKNKQHKTKFYNDFSDHENSQCIDNMKHTAITTSSSDSIAKKYSSKDYVCEESSIDLSNRITNKYNTKNIKRPNLRQYNNVTAKDNYSAQKNDEDLFNKKSYVEKLYEQFGIDINNKSLNNERHAYIDSFHQQLARENILACTSSDVLRGFMLPKSTSTFEIDCENPKYKKNHTTTLNNIVPCDDIIKESYEMQLPNAFENFLTPNIIDDIQCVNFHNRTKMFEPQIKPMEMKYSQESLVEKFDTNIHPKKLDGKNRLYRFDSSLQTSETSYNINAYAKQLTREKVLPKIKKHLFQSHNYHAINLRDANPCNFNVKSKKVLPQQTKLYICESNDAKQKLLKKNTHNRKNVLFNNINTRAAPSTLNFPENIQADDKRFRKSTRKEIFSKANIKCTRNQANLNHCNEQFLDCTRHEHKYNVPHHFHKEAEQTMVKPGILYEDNISLDNCINLSNDVPSLLLDQKHTAYTYPEMIDDQHRSVLLQNITQPIKYLAVNKNSDVQRIPIYINDKNVIENIPLKIITLVKPNAQTEERYFHKKYGYNLRK